MPTIGERVRVRGRDIVYFVIQVDERRREVDVMPVSGTAACLDAVPFSDLIQRPEIKPE